VKIINIVGARPNFMKIAPLMRAYESAEGIQPLLVHTGQHYDHEMSRLFFDELGIPRPDIDLEVGSGSHAAQTAEIMKRSEPVFAEHAPDLVLVVGDVNSSIACALVAAKLGAKVAHVEAGLRSFDRSMPEEINRVLTDAISDLLFVTEPSGEKNLLAEGVAAERIHLVGNVMIDTLLANLDKARAVDAAAPFGVQAGGYVLLTLHRPSNVDDEATFRRLWGAIERIAERLPVIFPCHPRTRHRLAEFDLASAIEANRNVHLSPPLGYLEFLGLMAEAAVVLTDSGGIQEETTILKVPCLTLRENTERPVTIECGANRLVGTDPERILSGFEQAVACDRSQVATPPLWDGHAAERIVEVLTRQT
jgi:UDP-N-acetylglucosamine 2-epimerase (non-hydrolysing)